MLILFQEVIGWMSQLAPNVNYYHNYNLHAIYKLTHFSSSTTPLAKSKQIWKYYSLYYTDFPWIC